MVDDKKGGIEADWNASDEILKNFIHYGRLGTEAYLTNDIAQYFQMLLRMAVEVDAFLKWDDREKMWKLLDENADLAEGLPEGVRVNMQSYRAVLLKIETHIRKSAQNVGLLMRVKDQWDADEQKAKKDEEELKAWTENARLPDAEAVEGEEKDKTG